MARPKLTSKGGLPLGGHCAPRPRASSARGGPACTRGPASFVVRGAALPGRHRPFLQPRLLVRLLGGADGALSLPLPALVLWPCGQWEHLAPPPRRLLHRARVRLLQVPARRPRRSWRACPCRTEGAPLACA